MRRLLIAGDLTPTNVGLLEAFRDLDLDASLMPIEVVLRRAQPGDAVLARLDVAPTLDGVDGGIHELERLEERGVRVLNGASALMTAHDKLATAIRLGEASGHRTRRNRLSSSSPVSAAGDATSSSARPSASCATRCTGCGIERGSGTRERSCSRCCRPAGRTCA
jgi:hypothetical protein